MNRCKEAGECGVERISTTEIAGVGESLHRLTPQARIERTSAVNPDVLYAELATQVGKTISLLGQHCPRLSRRIQISPTAL